MAAVMMAYPARNDFQGYPQQYAMYQTRARQQQPDATHSLNVNPYTNYTSAPEAQAYHPAQYRSNPAPQASAGEDAMRLPSISNLLVIADGDRPSQDPGEYLVIAHERTSNLTNCDSTTTADPSASASTTRSINFATHFNRPDITCTS